MDELNNILELVKNYIDKKEKTWTPGKDWVQYAGPYFTSEEYTSSIKSRCLNLLKINLSYRFSMQFTSYDILIYNYSPFITYCSILYYSLTLFIFI